MRCDASTSLYAILILTVNLAGDKVLSDAFPAVRSDGRQFTQKSSTVRSDASGIPAVRSDGRQFTQKSSTVRSDASGIPAVRSDGRQYTQKSSTVRSNAVTTKVVRYNALPILCVRSEAH